MPRVVPSQVVSFINSVPLQELGPGVVSLNHVGSATLSCVLDLVDEIPNELLNMDSADYASFVRAKSEIRNILSTWQANQMAGRGLHPFHYAQASNPLALIHGALAKCPDESPAPSTSELSFVADANLRANLRNDIGAVSRALSNGEWKAATVLAGSAAEALLLWALKQKNPGDVATAITAAKASGELTTNPNSDLDRWNLHEYIEVALKLGIIKSNTAKQARLAKDFRNFIHPGVAQRLGEKCDLATALSAVAGVEHVVRDLTP